MNIYIGNDTADKIPQMSKLYLGNDLLYEKIIENNILSFEFDKSIASSVKYSINREVYTAYQTPFSIDIKKGLGISEFFDAPYMFANQANITKITSIPDTSSVTSMNMMFKDCENLLSINTKGIKTDNCTTFEEIFSFCKKLKNIDVSNWNTSKVTNFSRAFNICNEIETIDLSNWDVSKGIDFENMFYECYALKTLNLNGWNISPNSNFNDDDRYNKIFSKCTSLQTIYMLGCNESTINMVKGALKKSDIPDGQVTIITDLYTLAFEFDKSIAPSVTYTINGAAHTANETPFSVDIVKDLGVSNFTSASDMFAFQKNITKITSIPDTTYVTDMSTMFNFCSSLMTVNLSKINTKYLRGSLLYMFRRCYKLASLDLSNFNTQNVDDMYGMFTSCSSLTSLDLSNFNTQNVDEMTHMFSGCSSLTSLDLSNFQTYRLTAIRYMFYSCSSLATLDLSGWHLQSTVSTDKMFEGCTSLKTIYMRNCDQPTIDKIKAALTQCGIPDGQVTIVTE